MRHLLVSAAAVGLLAATPALAQDAAQLQTDQSEEFGTYLTDGGGRPVYLFTADTQGTADQQPQIACGPECLQAWPLFTTQGEPQAAGEEVQADLIGTMQHDGQTVVTYDGWPLYYFVRDEGVDTPQGNDIESFGGEWYLVTPEGQRVGHE